jgi:hypothetical protein
MRAEQIKRLAYDFADALSKFDAKAGTQDAVIAKQAALHAAIDAHTAKPPINAAAQEPVAWQARNLLPDGTPDYRARMGQWTDCSRDEYELWKNEEGIAVRALYAAPNEPVAPLPSATVPLLRLPDTLLELLGDYDHKVCSAIKDYALSYASQCVLADRAKRASPQAVPAGAEELVSVPRRLIWQAFNALDEVDYENDPPDRILAVMTELRAAKDASPVLPEAPKAPEWKLVPIEPTEEMIDAGCEVEADELARAANRDRYAKAGVRLEKDYATNGQILAIRYKAMLAAAPTTEEAPKERE